VQRIGSTGCLKAVATVALVLHEERREVAGRLAGAIGYWTWLRKHHVASKFGATLPYRRAFSSADRSASEARSTERALHPFHVYAGQE
jgi:hypothetical protein